MNARAAVGKRLARVLFAVGLVLFALSPLAANPPNASAAGPYVVNTASDGHDSAPDALCSNGVDGCSLRAAIEQASSDGVPTTITFAIGLAGSTLLLDNALGMIVWTGSSITVTGGANNISVSGENLSPGETILRIEGNDNFLQNITIKKAPYDGIQIGDFSGTGSGIRNLISNVTLVGNGGAGIYVHGGVGSDGTQNIVTHSALGHTGTGVCTASSGNHWGVYVDGGANGTFIDSNVVGCNTAYGVDLVGTQNVTLVGNRIGNFASTALPNGSGGIWSGSTQTTTISGNTISGNTGVGLWLNDSAYARVNGNNIGVTFSGASLGNSGQGLAITDGAHNNTIGGLTDLDHNFISSNGLNGVLLDGPDTRNNWLAGNYIGTNDYSFKAFGNSAHGVAVTNGAHDNLIGGAIEAARNIISGNAGAGVYISGSSANTVNRNVIGTNSAANILIPNGQDGIWITAGSSGNIIGSSDESQPQFIAGNAGSGILILNSANNEVLRSNYVGVGPTGAPIGNVYGGIMIINSTDNRIEPIIVSNNIGPGVAVVGAGAAGNHLAPVLLWANSGLPIDLGADDETANDAGDGDTGPNTLLNYPVVSASHGNVISGTVCADCYVFIYVVAQQPAPTGRQVAFLQSVHANSLGAWSATLLQNKAPSDVAVQAHTGLTSGNSSEISPHSSLFLPLIVR